MTDQRQLREKYRRIYSVVKAQLDEFDAYGLLAGGCPADEFEQEAQMSAARLRRGMSVSQIACLMADVMNAQFESIFSPEEFLPFAAQIEAALHEDA